MKVVYHIQYILICIFFGILIVHGLPFESIESSEVESDDNFKNSIDRANINTKIKRLSGIPKDFIISLFEIFNSSNLTSGHSSSEEETTQAIPIKTNNFNKRQKEIDLASAISDELVQINSSDITITPMTKLPKVVNAELYSDYTVNTEEIQNEVTENEFENDDSIDINGKYVFNFENISRLLHIEDVLLSNVTIYFNDVTVNNTKTDNVETIKLLKQADLVLSKIYEGLMRYFRKLLHGTRNTFNNTTTNTDKTLMKNNNI
ncbi:hypothetical protein GJ496_004441 [Pomphorhynchus laevis]|nr:hypothetical protein GJ496_005386 [Pomphorhynchus laevis]KAI0981298.1 hypothetical protein GJ496_004441 [Pomphorhynchus laevis]